jgi:hypothetical protein
MNDFGNPFVSCANVMPIDKTANCVGQSPFTSKALERGNFKMTGQFEDKNGAVCVNRLTRRPPADGQVLMSDQGYWARK